MAATEQLMTPGLSDPGSDATSGGQPQREELKTGAPPVKTKRNQFGEVVVTEERMTIDKWVERWDRGQTRFHVPHVHVMLERHIEKLTGGRSACRILMPLCGKSIDLNWLAVQGHHVVGVEAVELGCRQFFEENDIAFTVEDLKSVEGKVLKSTNPERDVTLYCCDFLKVSRELLGEFDGIWDRGSLAAIDTVDRKQYAEVLTKLITPTTIYMLDCFLVDNDVFAGPPFNLTIDNLQDLYGGACSVKLLDERDSMSDWTRSWGVEYFMENVYLMQAK